MPIFAVARAIPMVLMNKAIGPFWWAKTCSTKARTLERLPLALEARSDIGLPLGFLVWMCETKPFLASHVSFFFDRYAVSAHTPDAVVAPCWPYPKSSGNCAPS